jgi:hypothetical protein
MSVTEDSGADSGLETHQATGPQPVLAPVFHNGEPDVSGNDAFPVVEESDDQDYNDDSLHSNSGKADKGKRPTRSLVRMDIDEISDLEERSFFTRSNRFLGPESTWRSWNTDEREVVYAIDEERAQDLSIHLFNAHSLRQRAQRSSLGPRKKMKRRRSEGESSEVVLFDPPKSWTAWPLPPFEVPRTGLIDPTDDPRPSATLEECFIAVTMRAARRRWEAREWESEEEPQHAPDTSSPVEDQLSTKTSQSEREHGLPRGNESNSDMVGVPVFTLQSVPGSDESVTREDEVESSPGGESRVPESKPVPLADNETARVLLLPSTRHILGKLDDTLRGLHHARQSYAAGRSKDKGTPIDSASEITETSWPSTRGRTSPPRHRAVSVTSVASDASTLSTSTRRTKAMRSRHKEPHDVQIERLGLRDWSDVLGMAALTGWDEQVLRRASKRCADLFGDDMLFRTFYEGGIEGEDSHFKEFLASGNIPEDDGNTASDDTE